MTRIDVSIDINASIDKVWDIVTDLDNEPKFWKGTLNIKPKENGLTLEANWDIKMTGLAGMFTGMIKKHVRGGTEQALKSIKLEAESQ